MKKSLTFWVLTIVVCSFVFTGCVPSPYYERTESIPDNAWNSNFRPSFKFEITDTNALYNLQFIMRHTDAYQFQNLWILVYVKQPEDTAFSEIRLEVLLAEASGKWMGRGMGEIYERRWQMPVLADFLMPHKAAYTVSSDERHLTETNKLMQFHKKGVYEIRIEQNMRVNPLPEVLHIGLRIEKAAQQNK
jgi:gliding motility-associated lipoprotein GldH